MLERETLIREQMRDIGEDVFPDDTDVEWQIVSFRHDGQYSCVEAKPVPDTVGYPAFRFVVHVNDQRQWQVPACYCLSDGQWTLLCSDPTMSAAWKDVDWCRK